MSLSQLRGAAVPGVVSAFEGVADGGVAVEVVVAGV
jgi:hypothetical protein